MFLALDYCREYVICVSEDYVSERVVERAKSRGKRVLHVSLSQFRRGTSIALRTPIFGSGSEDVN